MPWPSANPVRLLTLSRVLSSLVGVLLFAASISIIAAEAIGPALPHFPVNRQETGAWSAARDSLTSAASAGVLRGDLVVQASIAHAAGCLFAGPDTKFDDAARTELSQAHILAERGAALSPHDARVWLVLACLASRNDQDRLTMVEALKLSYYTAPIEPELAPLRLFLSFQFGGVADAKTVIETILAQLDPGFLETMKSGVPKQSQ
jgi:hypothetical protein